MRFPLLDFTDISFLQSQDLWQPCIKPVYQHHFFNCICSLHIAVSHFGNSGSISDFFSTRVCQFKLSMAVYENDHVTTASPTLNVIFFNLCPLVNVLIKQSYLCVEPTTVKDFKVTNVIVFEE